jgi:hypothetical protein
MPVALYLDVHVPQAVADQLSRRGVDVLTAFDDGSAELSDDMLLDHSTRLGRVLITFDVRFKALAEHWQHSGRGFGGLIYAHPLRVSIGQLVHDLEIIAKTSQPDDWTNYVERLPL